MILRFCTVEVCQVHFLILQLKMHYFIILFDIIKNCGGAFENSKYITLIISSGKIQDKIHVYLKVLLLLLFIPLVVGGNLHTMEVPTCYLNSMKSSWEVTFKGLSHRTPIPHHPVQTYIFNMPMLHIDIILLRRSQIDSKLVSQILSHCLLIWKCYFKYFKSFLTECLLILLLKLNIENFNE